MLAHLFSARENTEGTNTGSCQFVFSDVELSAMPSQALGPVCRRRSRFHLVARGRAADMAVADSGRFRNLPPSKPNWHPSQSVCSSGGWILEVTAVGFEPTPFRNGALSHRLGQAPHGSWMIQVGGDTSRALRRWGQHGKGDGAFFGRPQAWAEFLWATQCHRSHFGSRYTLGCCGHAGPFRRKFDPDQERFSIGPPPF